MLTIDKGFAEVMRALGDAERGRLFTAMCVYAETGAEIELRGNERYVFPAAKKMIDELSDNREISQYRDRTTVKNHTKINNTINNKSLDYSESFEQFWITYPKERRIDKQKAYQSWKKQNPDDSITSTIMDGLQKWKRCDEWADPRYIPHPTTWINNRRWEVEPPTYGKKNPALRYAQSVISDDDFNSMIVDLTGHDF